QRFGFSKEVFFAKQRIYLKQNKLDEALAQGEKMVDLYPEDADFVLNLSELYLANNRESEAIPYLESYLRDYPDHARARLILAEIFKKQGKVNESIEQMIVAFSNPDLELTPKLNVLVEYMKQLPNPTVEKNALMLAQSIVEAHPYDGNAHAVFGDLYLNLGRGDNSEEMKRTALGYYQKALSFDDSNFNIWQNVLQIEGELMEYDSLVVHSDQALEVFPNQAPFYYYSGFANLSLDNFEEAAFALEQGKKLSRSDNNLQVLFNTLLGDTYNQLEDHEKSDQAYEDVLTLDPDNDHVLNNYSYFLSLRKAKLEKAKKMSTKLVKRNPNNPTFLDTHAWVLYNLGDYREAKRFLESAIQEDASGTIVEHYGDVLFKLGDIEDAVKQWNRAKGMDDTSELIDKKIADRKLYE
ncbi:MAG: tetratricopeptide repeat protein, partial [Cyclobacteriaceae bacterium]|nr:tetratricopeptide repeat protein [Cyclobacteriaceae bacterium]